MGIGGAEDLASPTDSGSAKKEASMTGLTVSSNQGMLSA